MAKHTKKHEEVMTEKPAIIFLVNKLVKEEDTREWTIEQLSEEGPKHKQLQNELLFEQLSSLVKSVEKRSGQKLALSQGHDLSWVEGKERIDFPVPLSASAFKKLTDPEHDLEEFVAGPEHETLMYSIAIQVLDWAATTIKEIE